MYVCMYVCILDNSQELVRVRSVLRLDLLKLKTEFETQIEDVCTFE